MRFALILPARFASTRLPRKLLLAETGLPLVCHTVETACAAQALAPELFAETLVATDHADIFDAVNRHAQARGLPARAVMTRADHPSGSDRIAEAAAALPRDIDAIMNLQADEPEMDPAAVVRLARALEAGRADIATLVHPIRDEADFRNPNLVKAILGADEAALYFSRAPVPFDRERGGAMPPTGAYGHLGIYAYRRDALERFVALPPGRLESLEKLEQLRALENGLRIVAVILDTRPPKGIDAPGDYQTFVERRKARR